MRRKPCAMHKLHFANSNTQTGAVQPSPIMPSWNATGISPCIGVIKIKNMKNENKNELTVGGWHSDENETFTGIRNDSHGNDCRDHDQDAWNYEIDETDCWK